MVTHNKNIQKPAKPFVKWVGGKAQLLSQISNSLPKDFSKKENITYIEPFVGGGAVLFWILQEYKNITTAVINDINPDLITVYKVIKENPQGLIARLQALQDEYLVLNESQRKNFYLLQRDLFNQKKEDEQANSALFIFLNRTCFNGLYRVNSKGLFNVPHGRYVHPKICDADTILADSKLLQRVTILCGDFSKTIDYANEKAFFYFDPPYKPISITSSFTSYTKENFDDNEQLRLRNFCYTISKMGSSFILSNSDVKTEDNPNNFFDDIYKIFNIQRVLAARMINSNAEKRGKLSELMISNINTAIH